MAKTAKKSDKVLTQIKKLTAPYDAMGERLHELILRTAPELEPIWRWGLAFYTKDGEDICYFKKLKNETCMTFGFGDAAQLSPDTETPRLMPCAWSFTALDDAAEARLAAMLRNAVGTI